MCIFLKDTLLKTAKKLLFNGTCSFLTQVTRRMFAKLSSEVAKRVKEFYNLDMKMFGYKPYPS